MNGQPSQTREFQAVGPGRQQFHKVVTRDEGYKPTRKEFEEMTKVIEDCLDKVQHGLTRLDDEVSGPGSLILEELRETMTVLRSTTHCDLPGFTPPEQ